jgi:Flp pilus assembly protein TadD
LSNVSPPAKDARKPPMSSSRESARAFAPLLLVAALLCAFATARLEADARQQQGPSAEAVRQLVERVQGGPLDDTGFSQARDIGFALIRAARFEEAAALLGALAELRPNDPASLYGAALAAFNAGRAAMAEPLARRAAEAAFVGGVAQEGAADALVLLAVVLAVRGDDAGALKAARRAAELAPRNFDAQFTLGRALYGAGDSAGAALAFRAAVALRPGDARALFFLATALERAGDDAGALAAYKELVRLKPNEVEGHLGLGVLLVKKGGANVEEGLSELARALEINPNLYEARVTLGRALVTRGRAAEAVEHLKRAAALAPENPEPHYQLSIAYRRLGRKEEAAAESEIVRRIHESRRNANVNANTSTDKPPAPGH